MATKPQFNIDTLNEQLYDQLQRLNTDLSPDELKVEVQKAKAMTGIAAVIIDSKRLQIEAIAIAMKGDAYTEQFEGILNQKQLGNGK